MREHFNTDNLNSLLEYFNKKNMSTFQFQTKFSSETIGEDENFEYVQPIKELRGGCDYYYSINKHGFRCNNFSKLNENNYNILYAGCSFTFGEYLPDGLSWTNFLTNKIKNKIDKEINEINLGVPAGSIDLSINNAMSFIRNYGKPDFIIMYFPETTRKTHYSKKRNKFFKLMNIQELNRFYKEYSFESHYLEIVNKIFLFEDFCKESKINLIWTTWYEPEAKIYNEINFSNYLKPTIFYYPDTDYKINNEDEVVADLNIDNLPFWELASDNSHPGTRFSTYFSKQLFSEWEKIYDK